MDVVIVEVQKTVDGGKTSVPAGFKICSAQFPGSVSETTFESASLALAAIGPQDRVLGDQEIHAALWSPGETKGHGVAQMVKRNRLKKTYEKFLTQSFDPSSGISITKLVVYTEEGRLAAIQPDCNFAVFEEGNSTILGMYTGAQIQAAYSSFALARQKLAAVKTPRSKSRKL